MRKTTGRRTRKKTRQEACGVAEALSQVGDVPLRNERRNQHCRGEGREMEENMRNQDRGQRTGLGKWYPYCSCP